MRWGLSSGGSGKASLVLKCVVSSMSFAFRNPLFEPIRPPKVSRCCGRRPIANEMPSCTLCAIMSKHGNKTFPAMPHIWSIKSLTTCDGNCDPKRPDAFGSWPWMWRPIIGRPIPTPLGAVCALHVWGAPSGVPCASMHLRASFSPKIMPHASMPTSPNCRGWELFHSFRAVAVHWLWWAAGSLLPTFVCTSAGAGHAILTVPPSGRTCRKSSRRNNTIWRWPSATAFEDFAHVSVGF